MTTQGSKNASHKDWHPAKVKMELHMRGITFSGIAEAHGMSSTSGLSAALVRSYPVNERRIADALGKHPMEIWPSRYFDNGERKPQGFRAVQCTAAEKVRNVKIRAAA